MEAVTRKEKILDGQDLTPLNRKEYFMKKAVSEGGGGSVPTPADADTGKVLTANNGAMEWNPRYMFVDTTLSGTIYTCNKTFGEIYEAFTKGLPVFIKFTGGVLNNNIGIVWTIRNDANQDPPCYLAANIGDHFDASGDSTDFPQFNYD